MNVRVSERARVKRGVRGFLLSIPTKHKAVMRIFFFFYFLNYMVVSMFLLSLEAAQAFPGILLEIRVEARAALYENPMPHSPHRVGHRTMGNHAKRCLASICHSPCASLAGPPQLPRRRSRLGLRMRMGASRTCRRPTPSGHPPGSQARGRDALRTLFRAAPALGMAVVRRDHLLFAPQVHRQRTGYGM